jgi:hypothetical protein
LQVYIHHKNHKFDLWMSISDFPSVGKNSLDI